jgi:hypothetical protein
MTTSTHSHKAWTDKGGHVKAVGALVMRCSPFHAVLKPLLPPR